MRTRNLAIVFTDIAGFTARTARQTHEENRRLLRAHDALLKPVFRVFGGRVIKAMGDAFLVVFPSPTEAVLCGTAVQDRLWQWNRRAPEGLRLDVRIAINVGEVRLERDDVFGAPVNVASRVEALAQPGQVVFTEMVYQAIERGRLSVRDLGPHELRGVPESVRLFAVERGEKPEDPPFGGIGLKRLPPLPELDEAQERRQLVRRRRTIAAGAMAASAAFLLAAGTLRARPQPVAVAIAPAMQSLPPEPAVQPPPPAKLAESASRKAEPIKKVRRAHARSAPKAIARAPMVPAVPLPPPRPTSPEFDKAATREAARDWGSAAYGYEMAARQGDDRGRAKLVAMLAGAKCEARAHAAQALARLGDAGAVPHLRALAATPTEELAGEGSGLTLFDCSSKSAAREALRRLDAHAAR